MGSIPVRVTKKKAGFSQKTRLFYCLLGISRRTEHPHTLTTPNLYHNIFTVGHRKMRKRGNPLTRGVLRALLIFSFYGYRQLRTVGTEALKIKETTAPRALRAPFRPQLCAFPQRKHGEPAQLHTALFTRKRVPLFFSQNTKIIDKITILFNKLSKTCFFSSIFRHINQSVKRTQSL